MFSRLLHRHRQSDKSSSAPKKDAKNPPEEQHLPPQTAAASADRKDSHGKPRLVHTQSLSNTSKALLCSIPLGDVRWCLKSSSWITETRTYYAINDVGEYLFLQVAYTDSGWPIKASCQVSACYFDTRQANEQLGSWQTCTKLKHSRSKKDPRRGLDGHIMETVNQSANKLHVSESKTALCIAKAEMRLVGPNLTGDHDAPTGKLEGEHPQEAYRCCYEGNVLTLDLVMEAAGSAVSFGDGNISFGTDESDGTIHMTFIPGLRFTGTLTVDGNERQYAGLGFGLHQVQGVRPNQVAARWNMAIFLSDRDADGQQTTLFMIQICAPSSYDNEVINYGIYLEGEVLQALCKQGEINTFEPTLDPHSGYYVPREFGLRWSGETVDGDSFTAQCRVQPQVLIDRLNLLDLLPFVMRKIVETFVTRPYVYQWADRTTVTLERAGQSSRQLEGWLINELSILSDET